MTARVWDPSTSRRERLEHSEIAADGTACALAGRPDLRDDQRILHEIGERSPIAALGVLTDLAGSRSADRHQALPGMIDSAAKVLPALAQAPLLGNLAGAQRDEMRCDGRAP